MVKLLRGLMVLATVLAVCTAVAQTGRKAVNVGVMLPLHDVDGDGRRMVEYYRGMLLAVERLKQDGMDINVRAWNVPMEADVRTTLLKDGAPECNVIFGPLYSKQVRAMGDFCKAYGIRLVIPFSIQGDDVDKNAQIYQVYQSQDEMNTTAIQQIAEHFGDWHVVVVDCNDSTSKKGTFTFALRSVLEQRGRAASVTNLRSSDEAFAKAFSLTKPNLVILNTGRSPELTQAMNKLDVLTADNKNVRVALFGYTEWLMYAKYNRERFAKYDTYIPTNFYYNPQSAATKELEERYRQSFKQDMMYALPHFAITGYDHAMYFIGNRRTWLQNPLNFKKQPGGGYRNKAFMLVHYKQNGGIEAVTY